MSLITSIVTTGIEFILSQMKRTSSQESIQSNWFLTQQEKMRVQFSWMQLGNWVLWSEGSFTWIPEKLSGGHFLRLKQKLSLVSSSILLFKREVLICGNQFSCFNWLSSRQQLVTVPEDFFDTVTCVPRGWTNTIGRRDRILISITRIELRIESTKSCLSHLDLS